MAGCRGFARSRCICASGNCGFPKPSREKVLGSPGTHVTLALPPAPSPPSAAFQWSCPGATARSPSRSSAFSAAPSARSHPGVSLVVPSAPGRSGSGLSAARRKNTAGSLACLVTLCHRWQGEFHSHTTKVVKVVKPVTSMQWGWGGREEKESRESGLPPKKRERPKLTKPATSTGTEAEEYIREVHQAASVTGVVQARPSNLNVCSQNRTMIVYTNQNQPNKHSTSWAQSPA